MTEIKIEILIIIEIIEMEVGAINFRKKPKEKK